MFVAIYPDESSRSERRVVGYFGGDGNFPPGGTEVEAFFEVSGGGGDGNVSPGGTEVEALSEGGTEVDSNGIECEASETEHTTDDALASLAMVYASSADGSQEAPVDLDADPTVRESDGSQEAPFDLDVEVDLAALKAPRFNAEEYISPPKVWE